MHIVVTYITVGSAHLWIGLNVYAQRGGVLIARPTVRAPLALLDRETDLLTALAADQRHRASREEIVDQLF